MKASRLLQFGLTPVRVLSLSLCFLALSLKTYAADIVYVDSPAAQPYIRQQVETVATFYGLSMEIALLSAGKGSDTALSAIRAPRTLAVVVTADALRDLDRDKLLASLMHGNFEHGKHEIPLLIVGIDEHTDTALLKQWSFGAVVGSQLSATAASAKYAVASGSEVTRQLGGSTLPLGESQLVTLLLDPNHSSQAIIQAKSDAALLPVFTRVATQGHDIFLAAGNKTPAIASTPDPYHQQKVFAELASPLLFLRYAAGERAWHSPGDYANFTIDDLWLREPYGHVNYEGLLREAQQHNFHATIAFIPWNFDRSQPKMVSLFREHPERLSISVHGNNHVHQEFGPLDTHPLETQLANMKQGLARMERFTQLTGIPYDPVMVFPHSIAPQATFAGLKRYNYMATANSLSVPSDAAAPATADFALRTATLHFAGFPSLRRYSAETNIPETQLAIDAFLGNPMLFYGHEAFFAPGIGAFNKTADVVNRLQPDTQWKGLGYIARHLYLEKQRDDSDYDVRAYSATIELHNGHDRDAVYYLEKDEDFTDPFTLLVDGKSYPFDHDGTLLRLKLPIQKGATREISIRYGNDFNLATVGIAKDSRTVEAIRLLSDFRDNVVSNTGIGRRFIRSYADNGERPWNIGMAALAALLVAAIAGWSVMRRRKRAQREARSPAMSRV